MKLFCFASRNEENIRRGIKERLWAVANKSKGGRTTKARRYFGPGAAGILYCTPLQSFTTPFLAHSYADPERVVHEVWPEPWILPFKIEPLGDLTKTIYHQEALERWPFLQRQIEAKKGPTGALAAMNGTGVTVFVPVSITDNDWEIILSDLAVT